jgi:hypothetical protein
MLTKDIERLGAETGDPPEIPMPVSCGRIQTIAL